MLTKNRYFYFIALVVIMLFYSLAHGETKIKVSVFNFQPANLDAASFGATVTNQIMNYLMADPALSVLERKELEAFLALNDLQQNDNPENIIAIGDRLGLNAIIVGNVEKKGTVIQINCRIFSIEQRRPIFTKQIRALGEARLQSEVEGLSEAIKKALLGMSSFKDEKSTFKGPINIQKRAGNRRVYLSWENAPQTAPTAYEIFRAQAKEGPFVKVGQVTRPEFLDQNLENNVTYYYRIRALNEKGMASEYSDVFAAETALTPNPPVILRADGHIKSIVLVWTPNPISSGDPYRLRGYKLYRANTEKGPYKEVANILGMDLGIGIDTASTLDKLFKVTYTDKGLADGETYYYKLTAYNEKNMESDFSQVVKGTTLPVVTGLEAQGNMIREIRLSWRPLASPEVKGYFVYRSTKEDVGFTKIKRIDITESASDKRITFRDTEGLADNMVYYYRVTAFETPEVETSFSKTVSARTKGKPPTPEGFTAVSGLVKAVELRWLPSSDPDVEGYNIYASSRSDGEFVLIKRLEGKNTTRYLDDSRDGVKLEDNKTYYYRITAFNRVNVESLSAATVGTTKARPSRPKGLVAETGKVKMAPLLWQANPESDIVYYHIFRNDSLENREFIHIGKVERRTSFVDQGLKDGKTYRYAVQAEDKDGLLSEFSEIVTITTKPLPSSPREIDAQIRGSIVYLRWSPNPEGDIAYYTVYEKRFLGNEKIATVTNPEFTEVAPPKGKTKTYIITATDRDGLESEPSKEVTIAGR